MMTKNKILLLSVFVITISTILFGFSRSQEPNKEIATVRTLEAMSGLWDASIVTIYPNGEIEKIELEKMNHKDFSTNMVSINGHLNSMISKGYSLSSVSSGASEGVIVTTYTFTRE